MAGDEGVSWKDHEIDDDWCPVCEKNVGEKTITCNSCGEIDTISCKQCFQNHPDHGQGFVGVVSGEYAEQFIGRKAGAYEKLELCGNCKIDWEQEHQLSGQYQRDESET